MSQILADIQQALTEAIETHPLWNILNWFGANTTPTTPDYIAMTYIAFILFILGPFIFIFVFSAVYCDNGIIGRHLIHTRKGNMDNNENKATKETGMIHIR